MGLDPTSIVTGTIFGIATNLATDILKHYAQRLDGTLVGRGLKELGLIEKTRDDHLREILEEALQLYFETYPLYDISGVTDFFRDPTTSQQIGNYIFDHRPVDQQAIEEALVRYLKSDPLTMIVMQQRGGQPERIIPDFLICYRRVLNEHTDTAERAILLTVLDAADTVIAEIRASEERMKVFIAETLRAHTQAHRGHIPSLAPGQVIGQYRIQRQLTTGTFGTLYLAEQQDTKVLVVLKVVEVPDGLRLRRDVFSLDTHLVDLKHPSILPTLEVSLDGTPLYVVTVYVAGGSLDERIRRYAPRPLPLPEAFTILTQVGHALTYLHEQNVIHRGLQPTGILFDSTGNALLTGFDLAIMADTVKHHLLSNQVGTANYMAPEQADGLVSEKSDQYALGCIAYELCTGHLPFKGLSSPSSSHHQPKPLPAPRSFNHTLSTRAERAILKALSVDPNQRFDNVLAFLAALGTP